MRVLSRACVGAIFGAPNPEVQHTRAKRLDRASRLALAAAQMALRGAGEVDLGVFVLTCYGALAANAEHWQRFSQGGISGVSTLVFPATVPSAAAAEISIAAGAMGPAITLCGGVMALPALWSIVADALALGECSHALVGAVDGWHESLRRSGHTPEDVDGACFALVRADAETQLRPQQSQLSVVRAFALSLGE